MAEVTEQTVVPPPSRGALGESLQFLAEVWGYMWRLSLVAWVGNWLVGGLTLLGMFGLSSLAELAPSLKQYSTNALTAWLFAGPFLLSILVGAFARRATGGGWFAGLGVGLVIAAWAPISVISHGHTDGWLFLALSWGVGPLAGCTLGGLIARRRRKTSSVVTVPTEVASH